MTEAAFPARAGAQVADDPFAGRAARGADAATPAVAENTALTVAQAVDGVKAKVTGLVSVAIATHSPRVAELVTKAKSTTLVTDEAACEVVAVDRRAIANKRKELEDGRLGMIRRLRELEKLINAPYHGVIGELDDASEHLRKQVEPYLLEKDRKERERVEEERRVQEQLRRQAAEEERLKREEADRLQREAEEKERLAREAEGFEKRKLQREADEATVRATEANIEATMATEVREIVEQPMDIRPQSVAAKAVTGESIGLRGEWTHEVVDEALVPDEFWQINDALVKTRYSNDAARKAIAGPDGQPHIAGFRIYQKRKVR